MTAFTRAPILQRGEPFDILVDGRAISAYPGESVAAALLAAGLLDLRADSSRALPRGVFCGMGACFNCLVTVDGVPNVRSCAERVRPGQRVELNGHA